ncbi:hypothetical protein E2320_016452, partial [Naja naja]
MGDHNEPAEWQYQMAVCSQTFEDLPDQLEQLVIRCEGRGWQRRQIPTWRDRETRASSPSTFGLTQLLGEYSPPRRGRSTTVGNLPPKYYSPPRVECRGRMSSGTSSNEASPGCSPSPPHFPHHNQLRERMPQHLLKPCLMGL